MSYYAAEITASQVVASNLMMENLLETIRTYRDLEEYRDRINDNAVDFKALKKEMVDWYLIPHNLAWVMAADKHPTNRLVIITDPLTELEFQIDSDLPALSVKRIVLHQVQMQKQVILAIETNGDFGKGYVLLKAWTNFQRLQHTQATLLQVDLK